MFKLFQPIKFFNNLKAPKYILFLFVIVFLGLTEALIFSPEDYKQSDAVELCMYMFQLLGFL